MARHYGCVKGFVFPTDQLVPDGRGKKGARLCTEQERTCVVCGKQLPYRKSRYCSKGCARRAVGLGMTRSHAGHEMRPVVRDDGQVYDSVGDAAKDVRGNANNISRACRTGGVAYGHLWQYADQASD